MARIHLGLENRSINIRSVYKSVLFLTILLTSFSIEPSLELNCTGDPCMYGICLESENSSSYSCYCIDGYTGINCEINWDDCWSNPCLNGGTCNDAVAAYNCTCTEGFVGVNCEQKYSECSNHPCLNNGTCLDYDGFTCQCPDGYSGDYCEIDASVCNDTICKNSGECVEGPGFSFFCRCPQGWTGRLCEEDVDECVTSPCKNGGLCINVPASYTCACLFGFTGKDCDKAIVPCKQNPCENGAVCLLEDDRPVCYCVPDYHGSFCELRYDDCESKFANCENGGTCIDGVNAFSCSCPPFYGGKFCDEYFPPTVTFPETKSTFESTETEVYGITTITSPRSLPTDFPLSTDFSRSTSTSYTKWYPFPETTLSSVEWDQTHISTGESIDGGTSVFTDSSFTVKDGLSTKEIEESSMETKVEMFSPTTENVRTAKTEEIESSRSYDPGTFTGTTVRDTVPPTLVAETTIEETETITLNPDTGQYPTTSTERNGVVIEKTSETGFEEVTSVPVSEDTEISRKTTTEERTTRETTTLRTSAMSSESFTTTESQSSTMPSFTGTSIVSQTKPRAENDTDFTEFEMTTKESIPSVITECHGEPCTKPTSAPRNESDVSTECDCPQRRDGCETEAKVMRAAFNGKSYIRQQVDINVMDDKNATLHVHIKLRTQSKNGIVLHAYFDDERYASVYLELGSLKFQFSCGLETMLLGEIDSPVDNGYEVDIDTRFQYFINGETDKCSAKLLVNGTTAVIGEQILSPRRDLPRRANLHLGGIPLAFSNYFPHVAMGFVGCMNSLKVNGISRHFIQDSIETFQIEECTSFLCLSNPCQNFGACEEVNGTTRCKCIAGYTGKLCERSACDDNPCNIGATCISSPGTGFICVCPLGTHGLLCEEDTVIVRPSFSVLVPGFSSYVAYGVPNSIKDTMELKMKLIPRTFEQISLIAYLGQSGSRRDLSDHLSVTYVRGYIMLTWDLGSGVRRIFTSTPITALTMATTKSYKAHTLRIGRRGKDAWLAVDGLDNVTGRAVGSMTRLDVSPILYIGGHKSKNFEALPHDLPLHTGFSGCIFDVELRTDNTVFPITGSSPATGRGVGECHRNECIRHSCKNGAVCLNHGATYSCICTKDWMGPDCSIPAENYPTIEDHSCHTSV